MLHSSEPFVWIGCVFDSPDLDRLRDFLEPSGIHFEAEGSRVAGYALYVHTSSAPEVFEMLSQHKTCEPDGLRVLLHSRPLSHGEQPTKSENDQWLAWRQECFEKDK
jgi:hypothetical protein